MTVTHASHEVISFDSLKGDLSLHQVIISDALRDGALYRKLKKWLHEEENRYLVFIEEDEEHFLKMKNAPLSQDKKVRLYYYQEGSDDLFKEIAWEFLFLTFTYAAEEGCCEKRLHLFSKLESYHRGINLYASDAQDLGVRFLHNCIANQKKMAQAFAGRSLEGSCRGIPAIICGAGPSLNEALPWLKTLENRALLIAGGSAVAALSSAQVSPHFCAHFCPDAPASQVLGQGIFEVPHFYQNRLASSVLEKIDGPLLWMPEGGGYQIEKWFQEQYGISYDPLNSGWSIANFCTAIAQMLGCDPILCVGMDFCFPAQNMYAEGVAATPSDASFVQIKDSAGNEVYSKKDWMMSAEWMGDCVLNHPETQWVQAEGRGLDLKGFAKLSLNEMSERFLREERDLLGQVHGALSFAKPLGITEEKVKETCELLKQSFLKCDEGCTEMLKQWEKSYPQSPMQTGQYALLESDMGQESAYAYFIEPLWQIWKKPILRHATHPFEQEVHRLLFIKRAVEANLEAFS